jgi:DNA-binding transcriptional MerR regulator
MAAYFAFVIPVVTTGASEMYAIGKASAQSGVHIETIRYYERAGVVAKPGRSAGGRRLYTNTEIATLRFVKRCRRLGFSIAKIKGLLSVSSADERSCSEVKAIAEGHLVEIEAKIENLMGLRNALRNLKENCADGTSSCQMLEVLMSDRLEEGQVHYR